MASTRATNILLAIIAVCLVFCVFKLAATESHANTGVQKVQIVGEPTIKLDFGVSSHAIEVKIRDNVPVSVKRIEDDIQVRK